MVAILLGTLVLGVATTALAADYWPWSVQRVSVQQW
jgi:hypothetical protein